VNNNFTSNNKTTDKKILNAFAIGMQQIYQNYRPNGLVDPICAALFAESIMAQRPW
jgi:hypothetical protein